MKCEVAFSDVEVPQQVEVEWYVETMHGRVLLYTEELDEGETAAYLHESYLLGHIGEMVSQSFNRISTNTRLQNLYNVNIMYLE